MTINFDQNLRDFANSQQPLVSAIIPSYNKAQYLPETIASVLNQEYKNIEIIVVNDGSPDNTNEVVGNIKNQNPDRKIEILNKPNGGISDARNYGIQHANGRLILTIDGDDLVRPSFVSKAIDVIRSSDANLITCNVECFGVRPGDWVPNNYERFYIRYDNRIPTLTLYDKKLWVKTGGYKVAFAFVEDWEFFINCSRYGLNVHRIPEKLFQYRSSDSGLAIIFQDRQREVTSMVTHANHDLYPVEEVLWAHDFFCKMPDTFLQRFIMQDKLHPQQWLLKFWLAMALEQKGAHNEACGFYAQALNLSNCENWQPAFRLGCMLAKNNATRDAAELFHLVRTLRPDMARIVKDHLDIYEKRA